MAVPAGYDVGLLHAGVNGGVAMGFLLDAGDPEAFVEEQALIGDVAVDTAGIVSAVSYGPGVLRYRLRLQLQRDVLQRNHRPRQETPLELRAALMEYAGKASGLTLQLDRGDRQVLFVDQLRFISGPSVDGYVAIVMLVDVT